MLTLSQKIKTLFNNKKLSDYRIAKLSHVSQPGISGFRRGRRNIANMQLKTAEKLGKVYNKMNKKG